MKIRQMIEGATQGPVFIGTDAAHDCPPHTNSGLALIDTGRVSDFPISRLMEWNNARLIHAMLNNAPALADLVETVQTLMRYPGLKAHVGSEFFNPVEAALSKLSEEFQP